MTSRTNMADGGNQIQWYDLRRQARGGVHAYMDGEIQFLWSRVHRDVLAKLNWSCELFRDEVGTQLSSLREVQWQLVGA